MVNKYNIIFLSSLLLVFFCCFSIDSTFAGQADKEKYIFMDEPLPPYSIGETGTLSREGLSFELLSLIFDELGVDFEINLVPWGRAIKSVTHGKIDGIPLLMKNSEREKSMVFSLPLIETKEFFFYMPERHPGFFWNSYDDLAGKTIGLVNGYTYGDDFLEAVKSNKFKVLYSKDTEACLVKLLAGRVDFIVENETSVRVFFHANAEWRERIKHSDRAVSSCSWHMGISKSSPLASRMGEINGVIRKIKADGRWSGIVDPVR